MTTELTFYKENSKWYADVPQVPKEENEMVFGADTFLDKLSHGADIISIRFSDSESENAIYSFKLIEHDEYGATYQNINDVDEKMWLCNVVHDVCIEHPMELFILKVSVEPKNNLYEGRTCKNIAHGGLYTIIGKGLMKMEDGMWYDSVTYRGENMYLTNKPITLFTKKLSDFNNEFIVM
jgi:hypothetical protein